MIGKLILLSGPSGVGKGTIRQILFRNNKLNLAFSVSYTTRPIRPGEKNQVDYFFVSRNKFEKLIEQNEFLEWVEFNGNLYGTSKSFIMDLLNKGFNVVLEIDVEGVRYILKQIDQFKKYLTIFIIPPSLKELEIRLKKRNTESLDLINKRLIKAKKELLSQDLYQHKVVNDVPQIAAFKIEEIILKK